MKSWTSRKKSTVAALPCRNAKPPARSDEFDIAGVVGLYISCIRNRCTRLPSEPFDFSEADPLPKELENDEKNHPQPPFHHTPHTRLRYGHPDHGIHRVRSKIYQRQSLREQCDHGCQRICQECRVQGHRPSGCGDRPGRQKIHSDGHRGGQVGGCVPSALRFPTKSA